MKLGSADPTTLTRLDGRGAVGLVVYKDAGSNTVTVTRNIQKALGQLNSEFPDVKVTTVAAQADFVSNALGNLVQEIVAGGLLSLLVVVLLLGDIRSSFAVALIIPLSVLVSLLALQLLHVTINVLSLGGLALGVGMLVDNAIVVAEATSRHREEGMPAIAAAKLACQEVGPPLIAGTLTTLLVFGPIVFVRGLAAALFRDLSLSVVASLTASLLLALTLMPVLAVGRAGYRDPNAPPRHAALDQLIGRLAPIGHRVAEWYEAGMIWSLRRPRTVFAIAIVSVLVTGFIATRLPREILPQVDEGVIVASLRLPEGTSIEETTRQTARIEAAARQLGRGRRVQPGREGDG